MDNWKLVPFNKTYFACSNGYVYNKKGEKIGTKHKNGYNCVCIKDLSTLEFKQYYTHRLIWEIFNGKIPEGYEIDHIIPVSNGGTDALSNLRLVTHKENCNNELSIKNYSIANKKRLFDKSKKIYQYTIGGRLLKIYSNISDVVKYGYVEKYVMLCCEGIRKTHKGCKWEYKV